MYRQGDVLFVAVKDIPNSAKPANTNIIVHGETTGHAHRLMDGEVFVIGQTMYLNAGNDAEVVHEEHDTIHLPQGKYQVIRQREYDEKEIRYVSD